jgi:hypothetical protein
VWGENILNGSYKSVSYKSGEFTCYYGWESDINTHFSGNLLSNNHLIPSNEYVAGRIKNATIGDQIRIVGYLSDYSVFDQAGNKVFERPTSVSRNDAGNGACETIYVNDFKILKGNNIIYKQIRNYGAIVALGSLILLIVLFFITPSKKRETYKAKADILK